MLEWLAELKFNSAWTSAYSIIKLALCVWLFSRTLPHREPRAVRSGVVLVCASALTASSISLGFSIFPTLTDDLSYLQGIATFVLVLAIAVTAQSVVYDCPVWTSIFCGSMGYMLENLSNSVERIVGGIVPSLAYPQSFLTGSLKHWIVSLIVIAIAYQLLIRRIEKTGLLQIDDPVMVVSAALVVVVNMLLDLIIKELTGPNYEVPAMYGQVLYWTYLVLCVYLLYSMFEIIYNRRLQTNIAAVERLRAAEAKQYEMSRENIEAINLKCHDIKHQIRALAAGGAAVDGQVLADLSHEVDVYDSVVKSGNDALDTILTEKSLYCEKHGITLSCIADGTALDFVEPADLYSFFGNALDNAIEAVERLDGPECRCVSLIVKRAGDMASIHVENFFDGQVNFSAEGLPRTRKGDELNHGFGVRSMRMIVENLGGSLTCEAQGDIFHLNALIPLPED